MLIALYNEHQSSNEVARLVGLYPTGVRARLRRAGIALQPCKAKSRSKVPTTTILQMYEHGMSTIEIAASVGITKHAVIDRLHRQGVRMRARADYKPRHGAQHPMWKGGRTVDRQGYVLLSIGLHKRRLEHRVVMEKVLGRSLKTSEYVHHINGIRGDNRPENLVVTTPQKHETQTLIKALQRRICYLETVLSDHGIKSH